MAYKLLHGHGEAGPRGKRSYISYGSFKTKKAAQKKSKELGLDGKRIVPASKVKKSRLKGAGGLVYIQ